MLSVHQAQYSSTGGSWSDFLNIGSLRFFVKSLTGESYLPIPECTVMVSEDSCIELTPLDSS